MVHKKYIKIKGRTYGPYYYESYREDGKIKKRYIRGPSEEERRVKDKKENFKAKKNKRKIFNPFFTIYFIIILILLIATVARYSAPFSSFEKESILPEIMMAPLGATYGSNDSANLSIWDDTDLGEKRYSGIKVNFYANYTDNLGTAISNENGNCKIRYNFAGEYGNFEDMAYDSSLLLWKADKTFFYKGNYIFEVNCESNWGNINLDNTFIISNSAPRIFKTQGGNVDIDGNPLNEDLLNCVEDTLCIYNFSSNVSDADLNDVLKFNYIQGPNSTLTNFVLDLSTGILQINITKDADTGLKKIELTIVDNDGGRDTGILNINIVPVNDPPRFTNLQDRVFNRSALFEYYIIAVDEENNVPFEFNITFLSCKTAQWSDRKDTNCQLFNESDYTINKISYTEKGTNYTGGSIAINFTPSRNDVGEYIINFSIRDLNNKVNPYNNSNSRIINFSVFNMNEAPYFRYVCENERSTKEGENFKCYINASDIDEVNYLTFISNTSWFLNSIKVPVNVMTQFNGSAKIEFVPTDLNVGNWSINVTVKDTGSPALQNSSIFWFFVDNANDSVDLQDLGNVNVYTSESNKNVYINATDDDLLIPDKNVYNEKLIFTSNYSNCINIIPQESLTSTNITSAIIEFNPGDANCFIGGMDYNVEIEVRDANYYSFDSKVLTIHVFGNSAPRWQDPPTPNVLIENKSFYLNLSEYVVDYNEDSINFSYGSDTIFPSFNIDPLTGIIDFIPDDIDVGQHILIINASDGKTPSPYIFNFTIKNTNDDPSILLLCDNNLCGYNFTINSNNSNIEVMEDNLIMLQFFVVDNDLRIPAEQKGFYDEVLSIDSKVEGINASLFNFVRDSTYFLDRILFKAVFMPRKADIGSYNISVNISDLSKASSFTTFNLSVIEINHAPIFLTNLSNQATMVNRTLCFDIDAEDLEDGNESSGNLTYDYNFLDGQDFINHDETVFNIHYGILNITFNDWQEGDYHINISVNDSQGMTRYGDFWIYVLGLPQIYFPAEDYVFNLKEGNMTNLTFMVNSSRGFNLSYYFYINDILFENSNYYADGSNIVWQVVPRYTDETYGIFGNLSLNAGILGFEFLNSSRTWNANITHSNAPLTLIKDIGDKQGTYGNPLLIYLNESFSDVDAFDIHYNQSVRFSVKSNVNNSAISSSFDNWILILNAGGPAIEILNVTGSDFENGSILTNATSNNFKVEFKEPVIVPVPVPEPVQVSGGGSAGTSEKEKPVSLKIIMPGPISVKKGEVVIVPIEIFNNGFTTLNRISLSSTIAKDGEARPDIDVEMSKEFINSLKVGERENVSLTINVGGGELGVFELTLDAKVSDPDYKDWAKIFINFEEGETIMERLVFTEELLAKNPECIELKELLNETREYINKGDFKSAEDKLNEVINACREAISKQSLFSQNRVRAKFEDKIFLYLISATIIAIILGIGYYVYQLRVLKKVNKETFEETQASAEKV